MYNIIVKLNLNMQLTFIPYLLDKPSVDALNRTNGTIFGSIRVTFCKDLTTSKIGSIHNYCYPGHNVQKQR